MGINLKKEEKGILKYLGPRYEESFDLNDITKHLNKSQYIDPKTSKPIVFSLNDTRGMLENLEETGYVCAKTSKGEEKFYLAKGLGAGVRKRMELQGRGFFYEPSRLIKRLFGVVSLLAGIGLFVYQSPNVTGAVIGTPTNDFIIGALFIFVGLVLFFIKTKKVEKNKKSKKRK
jgi:hypothetical protein